MTTLSAHPGSASSSRSFSFALSQNLSDIEDDEEQDKHTTESSDDDDEEEEEEDDNVKFVVEETKEEPAPVRKRRPKQDMSPLEAAMKHAERTSWCVGNEFEWNQSVAFAEEEKEVAALMGTYSVVHVSRQPPPTVQSNGSWEINLNDRKAKGKDVYSTCFYLGSSQDEVSRMRQELKAYMGTGKVCPLAWQPRLQIFLLPDRATNMKPVFVTLDTAKTLENYKDNNRIKSDEGKTRWAKATEDDQHRNIEDGWKLIWPRPLFQHHLEFMKKPPKKRSSVVLKPTPSETGPTAEQVLMDKMGRLKAKFPDTPKLGEFLAPRREILSVMKDAWKLRVHSASLADMTNNIEPPIAEINAIYARVKASKREDLAKAWKEEIDALPKDKARVMGIFTLALGWIDAECAASLVDQIDSQWEKVQQSMPVTADKDVYQERPTKKAKKAPGGMTQKTLF